MARQINRLSARSVSTIKKPGRHADGGNLYLNVSATGAKSWVFLYRFGGRQPELGLGSVNDVPLSRARETAASYRQMLARGDDPARSRASKQCPTFGECADALISAMEGSWRNTKHRAQWRMTLSVYAAPLRPKLVDQITTED